MILEEKTAPFLFKKHGLCFQPPLLAFILICTSVRDKCPDTCTLLKLLIVFVEELISRNLCSFDAKFLVLFGLDMTMLVTVFHWYQ